MVKRTNELGLNTLNDLVPEQARRKLSRREQTNRSYWNELGSSAGESDDSIKKANFKHPLFIAKQRVHNQKIIPLKSRMKERAYDEIVNINGRSMKWGDFRNKHYEAIELKKKKG